MNRFYRMISVLVLAAAFLSAADARAASVARDLYSETSDEVIRALQSEMAGTQEKVSDADVEEPVPEPSGGFLSTLGRTVGVLIVVVALMFLLSGGIKRFSGVRTLVGGRGWIRVVSKASLSPKAKVYLIEVEGRRILVGEAGGQVSPLHSYAVPEEAGEGIETSDTGAGAGDDLFRASLESTQTDKANGGFLDRVMNGIRDLRQQKTKLACSAGAALKTEEEDSDV